MSGSAPPVAVVMAPKARKPKADPETHANYRYRCSLPGLADSRNLHCSGPAFGSRVSLDSKYGGESGIRTRGPREGTHDFQSCTIGLSVTSPKFASAVLR